MKVLFNENIFIVDLNLKCECYNTVQLLMNLNKVNYKHILQSNLFQSYVSSVPRCCLVVIFNVLSAGYKGLHLIILKYFDF